MTLKQRRLLFFSFLILFLILSPIIIMYALGYVFDFESFTFQKTGALYVKTEHKNFNIILNNEIKKEVSTTPLFQEGVLISNLKNGVYNIKITANQRQSWEKNLMIYPGEVSEVKNVFLPKNEVKFLEYKNIENLISNSQKTKFAFLKNNQNKKEIVLINAEKNIKKSIIHSTKDNLKLIDISKDDKILAKNKDTLYLIEKNSQKIIIKDKKIAQSSKIAFVDNIIYFLSNNTLYKINKKNQIIKVENKILDFYPKDNSVVLVTSSPVFVFQISNDKKIQINTNPLSSKAKNASIYVDKNIITLKIDNDFFIKEPNKEFKKDNSILLAKQSKDLIKIAIAKRKEIDIKYLSKSYPSIEKDTVVVLGRFQKDVKNLEWYNNHYILYQIDDKIYLSEIDTRSKRNFYKIAKNIKSFLASQEGFYVFALDKDNNLKIFEIK